MIGSNTVLGLLLTYLGLWTPCNALFEEPRAESESVDPFLNLSDYQPPTIEDVFRSTVSTPTAHHHHHHHHEDYHTLGAPCGPTDPNSENPHAPFEVQRNSQDHISALNSEHPPFSVPSRPEAFLQAGRGSAVDDPQVPGRYHDIHPNVALQHSPYPSTHVQYSSPLPVNPLEDKTLEDMLAQLNGRLLTHYPSRANVVENFPQLQALGRGFGSHLHRTPPAVVESPDLINHSRQYFTDFRRLPASAADVQSRKRIRTSAHPTADAQFLIRSVTPSSSNHPSPSFHTVPVERISSDVHVSHKPLGTVTLIPKSKKRRNSKSAKRRKDSLPDRDGGLSGTPIWPLSTTAPVIPQVVKLTDILRFDREVFSTGKDQGQTGSHKVKALLEFIDSIKPKSNELYIPQYMREDIRYIWREVAIDKPRRERSEDNLASEIATAKSVEREPALMGANEKSDAKTRRKLKHQSMIEFLSVQAYWLQLWRDRAGITIPDDFHLSSNYGTDWKSFKNELTVFLFYVDMVATILREFRNANHQAIRTNEDINTAILQKAVRIAQKQSLKPYNMVNGHTGEQASPQMLKTPRLQLTWFWMTCLVSTMPGGDPFKSILHDEKNQSILQNAKVFFNAIFCYSIEQLNQRLLSYYSTHGYKLDTSLSGSTILTKNTTS